MAPRKNKYTTKVLCHSVLIYDVHSQCVAKTDFGQYVHCIRMFIQFHQFPALNSHDRRCRRSLLLSVAVVVV